MSDDVISNSTSLEAQERAGRHVPGDPVQLYKPAGQAELHSYKGYDPEAFTPFMREVLFLRVTMGESIEYIFNDRSSIKWPSRLQFYVHLKRDPEFKAAYEEALRDKYTHLADRLPDLVHPEGVMKMYGPIDRKLVADCVKFVATRLCGKYNDNKSIADIKAVTSANKPYLVIPSKTG